MASIEDFIGNEAPDISSFIGNDAPVKVVPADASSRAGEYALLSSLENPDTDIETAYGMAENQYFTFGSSQAVKNKELDLALRAQQEEEEAVKAIMADPSISAEQRAAITRNYLAKATDPYAVATNTMRKEIVDHTITRRAVSPSAKNSPNFKANIFSAIDNAPVYSDIERQEKEYLAAALERIHNPLEMMIKKAQRFFSAAELEDILSPQQLALKYMVATADTPEEEEYKKSAQYLADIGRVYETFINPEETPQAALLAYKMTGKADVRYASSAEAYRAIRKDLEESDPVTRWEKIQKIVDSVENGDFSITENNIHKLNMIQRTVGEYLSGDNKEESRLDLDYILDTIGSIGDWSGVLQGLKLASKAVKATVASGKAEANVVDTLESGLPPPAVAQPIPQSTLNTIRNADPEQAAVLAASGINNPKVAKALGESPETILQADVWPNVWDATIRPVSARITTADDFLAANAASKITPEDFLTFKMNYEKELADGNLDFFIAPVVRDVQRGSLRPAQSSMLDPSDLKTIVDVEGDYVQVRAVYGASDEEDFGDISSALSFVNHNFGDGENFTVLKRVGDRYEEVAKFDANTKSFTRTGEAGEGTYLVQMDMKYGFVKDAFDDARLYMTDNGARMFGSMNGYVKDHLATFDVKIAEGITAYVQGRRGVEAKLQRKLHPFKGIPYSGRVRVGDALFKGQGKDMWTKQELYSQFGIKSQKEIDAYYTTRVLMDEIWHMENANKWQRLYVQGNKSFSSGDKSVIGIPQTLDSVRGKSSFFDPETGKIVNIADLEPFYKQGKIAIKLPERKVMASKTEGIDIAADYAIVDLQKFKMGRLPTKVMGYEKGYFPRVWTDKYFLKVERTRKMDGKTETYTRAIASAKTPAEAERLKVDLENRLGGKIIIEMDKNLESMAREQNYSEISSAGILRGKRGEELITNSVIDSMENPIAAMLSAVNKTAGLGVRDNIMVNKQRWVNTWGKKFGLTEFPNDPAEIKFSYENSTSYGTALAEWTYLNKLSHMDLHNFRAMRDTLYRLSEAFAGISGKAAKEGKDVKSSAAYGASQLLSAAADLDPIGTMKATQFYTLLTTARSLLGNFITAWYSAGVYPRYFFGPGNTTKMPLSRPLEDLTALTSAILSDGKYLGAIQKQFKVSKKEAEVLFSKLRGHGILQNIDSHSLTRETILTLRDDYSKNVGIRQLQRIGKVGSQAGAAVRGITFNSGEYAGTLITWSAILDDFRRVHGRLPKTDTEWRKISARADSLKLSPTTHSEFDYQRNALTSIPMSFYNWNHKMLLSILPEMLGGHKNLTGKEKLMRAAIYAPLFGMEGYGLGGLYSHIAEQNGWEADPVVERTLRGASFEMLYNAVFGNTVGDEDYLRVEGIAPGGGAQESLIKFLIAGANKGYFETIKSQLSLTGGSLPIHTVLSRFEYAYQTLEAMTYAEYLPPADRARFAASSALRVFSGVDRWIQARAALKIGMWVDRDGDPIAKATYSEAISKGLFGINSEKLQDYYDITGAVYEGNTEGSRKRVSELVDTYYKMMHQLANEVEDIVPGQPENVYDAQRRTYNEGVRFLSIIPALLEPEELVQFHDEFQDRLLKGVENKTDVILDKISKMATSGDMSESSLDYWMNKVERSPAFNVQQKAQLKMVLEQQKAEEDYMINWINQGNQ